MVDFAVVASCMVQVQFVGHQVVVGFKVGFNYAAVQEARVVGKD